MGILTALLAFIGRQAGRIINVVFGWATVMLFGRVPAEKQTWLSVVTLGAIAWLASVIGVIYPRVGTFLIGLAPAPSWVPTWMLRLVMLAAVFVLPLVVGAISSTVLVAEKKHGWELTKSILRGYPYTVALAITMVMMIIVVPFLKVPSVVRRWQDQHMAVMIRPENYNQVVDDVQKALKNADVETARVKASFFLRVPPKNLALAAGSGIANLVADNLAVLRGSEGNLELIAYPSDLMVRGEANAASAAKAAVSRELIFTDAYLTWTKEANELEDKIRALWKSMQGKTSRDIGKEEIARLQEIEKELNEIKVSFDQWEILYREKLQVEERLLETLAGLAEGPTSPAESAEASRGTTPLREPRQLVPAIPEKSLALALGGLIGAIVSFVALSSVRHGRKSGW